MNELKALLENVVLNDETKAQITEAFEAKVAAIKEATRAELDVEYAKKFVTEKTELATKAFAMVEESVRNEMDELRQDIKASKALEVNYAQKLQTFKEQYAKTLNEKFESSLVEAVAKEFKEVRAELLEAKKQDIGKKILEAVKDEMVGLGLFGDQQATAAELVATKQKLVEAEAAHTETKRKALLETLLAPLTGSAKEVMKTILENVEFAKVEQRFNETVEAVIGKAPAAAAATPAPAAPASTTVVLEGADAAKAAELARMRKLAGQE